MSEYSGKCDLADHFCMLGSGDHTEENINAEIARTDFYIYHDNKRHRLDIHNYKDLVPYFPYIIGVGAFNSTSGRNMIIVSSKSWVDTEEEDHLTWVLENAKREYRRCKRKKIPFDADAWYEKSVWNKESEKKEIIDRVAKYGEKATIEGIHCLFYDKWDRVRLAQEMSRVGYSDFEISQWVYQGRDYNWRAED